MVKFRYLKRVFDNLLVVRVLRLKCLFRELVVEICFSHYLRKLVKALNLIILKKRKIYAQPDKYYSDL